MFAESFDTNTLREIREILLIFKSMVLSLLNLELFREVQSEYSRATVNLQNYWECLQIADRFTQRQLVSLEVKEINLSGSGFNHFLFEVVKICIFSERQLGLVRQVDAHAQFAGSGICRGVNSSELSDRKHFQL